MSVNKEGLLYKRFTNTKGNNGQQKKALYSEVGSGQYKK